MSGGERVPHSISVVIPCYNGEAYLGEALDSVRSQTLPPTQVIVVDDGSTDGSAAIARGMAGITLVSQPNRGLPAARNAGLAVADGDLVAFLDADDVWEPRKLERQAAFLDDNPSVGYAFAHHRYLVEDPEALPGWLRGQVARGSEPSPLPSAWLVRRELFDTVGRFDESLHISDDLDWLMRATAAGVRSGTVPEVLVGRRIHASNLSLDRERTQRELLGILRSSLRLKKEAAARSTAPAAPE